MVETLREFGAFFRDREATYVPTKEKAAPKVVSSVAAPAEATVITKNYSDDELFTFTRTLARFAMTDGNREEYRKMFEKHGLPKNNKN
jgi:hypothetical protein